MARGLEELGGSRIYSHFPFLKPFEMPHMYREMSQGKTQALAKLEALRGQRTWS